MAEQESWETLLLLQGTQAALQVRQLDGLASLAEAEFKVFSQWGEDGIIEWLVSRLPGIPESFVEFGVEDYTEANTRFLLLHRNWRGLIIDGGRENISRVKRHQILWRHDLTAVEAFVTRDNINALITDAGFSGETGLLSVDIDGNDYWVWEAISCIAPWIVIVEYNAVLGDLKPLSVPYDAAFNRMAAHHSGLYWGASAPAFEQLAGGRGYELLGSNRAGNNLFFIRKDLAARTAVADRRPRPSRYAEARDGNGALTYVRGTARRAAIDSMAVVDVGTGKTAPLAAMGELYSPQWSALGQGKVWPEAVP